MTPRVALLAALLAPAGPTVHAEEEPASFKIVVNAANRGDTITRETVADIFLKKATRWTHGMPASPVDHSLTSKLRAGFSKRVLHQPVAAVQNYWQRQIFSGRDRPPPVKLSDTEVLAFVQSSPGGIGYVSETVTLPSGVKELRLVAGR